MKTKPTFVAIDMEKLNSEPTSVCEIGMVKYVDGNIVDSYTKKVRSKELRMDSINKRKLRHIKLEELKNEPTFSELYNEICTFIGDNLLVCHNVGADMNYLYYLEKEIGKEGICKHYYADTMEMSKRLLEGRQGLKDCFDFLFNDGTIFGETMVETHCAINDAKACARVFNELWQRYDCEKFIHKEPYIPEKERPKKNMKTACVSTEDMDKEDGLLPDFDFQGKIAVVSGAQDENERKDIITKLEQLGVKVTTSISGKTNILVVGSLGVGPSKKEKALEEKKKRPDTFHIFTAERFLEL